MSLVEETAKAAAKKDDDKAAKAPKRRKKAVPEGLWVKCPACESVLYRTDLEKNLRLD